MSEQLDMFPAPAKPQRAPYQRRSKTSKAAAEAIEPHLSRLQNVVLFRFRVAGARGLTLEELSAAAELKLQTVCARRRELDKLGLIIDSGRTRQTSSGRAAAVWTIK